MRQTERERIAGHTVLYDALWAQTLRRNAVSADNKNALGGTPADSVSPQTLAE